MAKTPGRDQRGPMERLVRIAATLRERGTVGETGERLAEIAGFDGERSMDQLKRDIRSLTDQGWQIDNVAGQGEPARYRMRTVDNRLRVRLTPPQQRALQRAVLLADRNDLVGRLGLARLVDPGSPREAGVVAGVPTTGHDALLATVLRAVRMGSLLRFTYKGATAGGAPGVGALPERHLVPPREALEDGGDAGEGVRRRADERRRPRTRRAPPGRSTPTGTRSCTR